MELLTIGLFCGLLLGCLALGLPITLALTGGLCIFLAYGAKKGFSARELWDTVTQAKKEMAEFSK